MSRSLLNSILWPSIAICHPRSTIGEKCEPKPILARAQVPQRVINDSDISVSHRLPVSSNYKGNSSTQSIIVKLERRNVRDQLYKSRVKLKNLNTIDLGLGRQGENRIYIQESLTCAKKMLFKKCLETRKNNKLQIYLDTLWKHIPKKRRFKSCHFNLIWTNYNAIVFTICKCRM